MIKKTPEGYEIRIEKDGLFLFIPFLILILIGVAVIFGTLRMETLFISCLYTMFYWVYGKELFGP